MLTNNNLLYNLPESIKDIIVTQSQQLNLKYILKSEQFLNNIIFYKLKHKQKMQKVFFIVTFCVPTRSETFTNSFKLTNNIKLDSVLETETETFLESIYIHSYYKGFLCKIVHFFKNDKNVILNKISLLNDNIIASGNLYDFNLLI